MADLTLPLRRAVITHLKTDPAITALVGQRVYNETPADPVWPFILYGNPFSSAYEQSCADGIEAELTIHAFAKGPTSDAASGIAAAIVKSLTDGPVFDPAGDVRADAFEWERTQTIRDSDEKSAYHAIVDFTVRLVEPR